MQAHLIPQETPRSIFVYFRGLFYDVNNDPEGGYYARYAHTELSQVACHNWVWKLWSGVLFFINDNYSKLPKYYNKYVRYPLKSSKRNGLLE